MNKLGTITESIRLSDEITSLGPNYLSATVRPDITTKNTVLVGSTAQH